MHRFSSKSLEELKTCHPKIQKVLTEVLKYVDFTVLEGRRSKERQNQLYAEGRSKLQWPNGKHNVENPEDLAKAVDAVPYPIIWPNKKARPQDYAKDLGRLYAFVGFVLATAASMGIKLRCGADWDGDWDFQDQNFDDLPHFELEE